MAKNDGGPAFPVSTRAEDIDGGYGHQDSPSTYQFGGMSLRDYFAAKALGSLADIILEYDAREVRARLISEYAYLLADAMLAEREKQA